MRQKQLSPGAGAEPQASITTATKGDVAMSDHSTWIQLGIHSRAPSRTSLLMKVGVFEAVAK